MKSLNLDVFLVPRIDMFSGEEVPLEEERLKFISNFTGSAGIAIISVNPNFKSAIFSDGRYQLQIKKEVDIKYYDAFNGAFKEVANTLIKNKHILKKIGIDPWLITIDQFAYLKDISNNLKFLENNLIDEIWFDRPIEIQNKIFELGTKYTGEDKESKIERLAATILENKFDFYILFNPMGLCWLLNIRAMDLKHTPVLRAFCFVSKFGEVFVFSKNKSLKRCLNNSKKIYLYDFEDLSGFLEKNSHCKILFDPKVLPLKIYDLLNKNKIQYKKIQCPVDGFKTIKNSNEVSGFKNAHLKDGLAILKLFSWIEKNVSSKKLTEISIAEKLLEIRSLDSSFVCESFSTISAFRDHGAIIHYKASELSNKKINKDGLYLIDTGAHYFDGTTDVTRTLLVGKPDAEMINDYTLVLKGHIGIATAVFPKKTKGRDLDVLARIALWSEGKDYAHGTGHGVGFVLSVHEGPISISKLSRTVIEPGMIISNEPGYYKTGHYGIRIENLELVLLKKIKDLNQSFLCFENLTRVPLEKKLIDKNKLTKFEIDWINCYHKKVFNDLSKLIGKENVDLIEFLKIKTSEI